MKQQPPNPSQDSVFSPLRTSLQNRLLVWFILVALVPATLILFFYYYSTKEQMQTWLIKETQMQLEHSIDLVDSRINEIASLSLWLNQNSDLQSLLESSPEQMAQNDELAYQFKKDLRYKVYSNNFSGTLLSLMILGENGLDIRSGAEASLIDIEFLKTVVKPLMHQGERWRYLSKNFTEYSSHSDILLYCYPISNKSGKAAGIVVLLLDQSFFSSVIMPMASSEEMFLNLYTESGQVLFSTGSLLQWGGFEMESVSQLSAWKISARVSPRAFMQQINQLMQSIVLLVIIAFLMTTSFAVLLSDRFATPLQEILQKTTLISKGVFPTTFSSNRQDEFGQLDWHITTMGMNLQTLLQQRLEDAIKAQRLEMKMLKAQMNPHFLYNSLNSIRVIASMQGKMSIATMIEKLTQILRIAMDLETVMIPLEDELQLLENYIYLQNIQMNGKIHYSIGQISPEALHTPVIKFLLQPLAENAILHGLALQPTRGTLFVNASIKDTYLEILIQDNGVGMTEERLAQVRESLRDESDMTGLIDESARGGIALKNLRQQLKLTYGDTSNLQINSVLNQGTEVIVRIPISE